jgi:hypothetical protein
VTWLLLTGVGLVAETAVIVALARSATAMTDEGEPDQYPPVRTGPLR